MSSGTLTGGDIWITQKLDWRGGTITSATGGVMYLTGGSVGAPNLIGTTTAKTLSRRVQVEAGDYLTISGTSTGLNFGAAGVLDVLGTVTIGNGVSDSNNIAGVTGFRCSGAEQYDYANNITSLPSNSRNDDQGSGDSQLNWWAK